MTKSIFYLENILAIDHDIVHLSYEDQISDSMGNPVVLREGLRVQLREIRTEDNAISEELIADGKVILKPIGCLEENTKWFVLLEKGFRPLSRYKSVEKNKI